MTLPLRSSVEILVDEMRASPWTRDPYRHLKLALTIFNDGDDEAEGVSCEMLLPEEIVLDSGAGAWNPTHRHAVDGTTYLVWDTLGGIGRFSTGTSNAVTIYAKGRSRETLSVKIKPYVSTAVFLWRLFQHGDPIADYRREELNFGPSAPAL